MNLHVLTLVGLTALPAGAPIPNLDFRHGLKGWDGEGLVLVKDAGDKASHKQAVSSSDDLSPKREGTIRLIFTVPEGAGVLHCSAYALFGQGSKADGRLDVLLMAEGDRFIPKRVREGLGWRATTGLLPSSDHQSRDYSWDISELVGKRVQIVIADQDPRPGCHLFCSAFRMERVDENQRREFAQFMQKLQQNKEVADLVQYESRHFLTWSNADPAFTKRRLREAETMYDAFTAHFTRKGFTLRKPAGKLMAAIFDSQDGFEAYLDAKLPSSVFGIYNHVTNRLVVYDLANNAAIVAAKKQAQKISSQIRLDLDRRTYVETIERLADEYVGDNNTATTMHEVAHQLSFNMGLMQRERDIPLWLAEGLACYCEPTTLGHWQGIGAINSERLRTLKVQMEGSELIAIKDLVGQDGAFRNSRLTLLGYAQCWALFRLLMEERPKDLKAYITLIADRKSAEHRLTDFRQVFGADLTRLERRYQDYVRMLVQQHSK